MGQGTEDAEEQGWIAVEMYMVRLSTGCVTIRAHSPQTYNGTQGS